MQVIDKCKRCGKSIEVNKALQNKNFMKDGKSIRLLYFDCPECGERCFVQIDDETSLSMLNSIQQTFMKFMFRRQSGKKISKKENSNFADARATLGAYRANLMREYTGKTVFDDGNGKEYVLRFFV